MPDLKRKIQSGMEARFLGLRKAALAGWNGGLDFSARMFMRLSNKLLRVSLFCCLTSDFEFLVVDPDRDCRSIFLGREMPLPWRGVIKRLVRPVVVVMVEPPL